jgi:hypothetical protein
MKMKSRILIITGALVLAFSILFFEQKLGKTVIIYPGQEIWEIKSWQFLPNHFNKFVALIGGAILVIGLYKMITKKK